MWLETWLINCLIDDASSFLIWGKWHKCLVCIIAISCLLLYLWVTNCHATRKFSLVICKLLIKSLASFLSEAMRYWNFWKLDNAGLFTINASNVSLKCSQLHVLPSNVGNAMVGNLMCELTCDLRVLLLFPDKLLLGELCLERGGSATGCKS